jgi:hypothetical protein
LGDNNTLIGPGATMPSSLRSNCIVLGGVDSTVFMGGGQDFSYGTTFTGIEMSLRGPYRLAINGDAGSVGAPLLSGGNNSAISGPDRC